MGFGIAFAPLVPSYVLWAAAGVALVLAVLLIAVRSRGGLVRALALAMMVLALALLWSLRLGGYLAWRNWGHEDRRYARLRQHVESQGKSYALHSLIHVNIYQGCTVVILAVPIVIAQAAPTPLDLGVLAYAGAALVVFGTVFEGVADLQLTRFRSDAQNAGKVLDTANKCTLCAGRAASISARRMR